MLCGRGDMEAFVILVFRDWIEGLVRGDTGDFRISGLLRYV